jgi:hypothetical protein
MNRRYAQWTDEELKRLAAIGAAAKACGKPIFEHLPIRLLALVL